jgi:cell wall-associated NlpC family hydrolase
VFSDPDQVQPGDIMMRGNHVAIYAGNGLAAQGGIGGTSVLTSISADPHSYALFVRVG